MKDKKNVFAAISDAARSVQDDEPEPDQSKISSKKKAGKRSHPDYRQTTIYINKQIEKKMKAAFLEDGVEDFSQWVEERIEEWLKGRKQG
ncbi:hypothetical protein FM036_31060 [Nostoc sp. HG1]|nr:hypothetical protein [Nostoc sp. HG1]